MLLKLRRIAIAFTFLSIFAAKMFISGAPVFFSSLDKRLMSTVIMQLEEERKGETGKDSVKFADQKLLFDKYEMIYQPIVEYVSVPNSFIEHAKRYIGTYHPAVPTPPPNFC